MECWEGSFLCQKHGLYGRIQPQGYFVSLFLSCSILFVMLTRGWISLSLLVYHQHVTLEKLLTLSAFGRKLQISEETHKEVFTILVIETHGECFAINLTDRHILEMKHVIFKTITSLFFESNINSYFEHILVYIHFHYLYIKLRCAQFPALLF